MLVIIFFSNFKHFVLVGTNFHGIVFVRLALLMTLESLMGVLLFRVKSIELLLPF